jgi:hypothetical protein
LVQAIVDLDPSVSRINGAENPTTDEPNDGRGPELKPGLGDLGRRGSSG